MASFDTQNAEASREFDDANCANAIEWRASIDYNEQPYPPLCMRPMVS
jgi:hypothetical protein